MPFTTDTTTFVCLFHHAEQATGAVRDLQAAGVPASVIYTLDSATNRDDAATDAGERGAERYRDTLRQLHVPDRDLDHLITEIGKGATLIAVAFNTDFTDRIEGIFQRHAAVKIDEALLDGGKELVAGDEPDANTGNTVGGFGTRKYRPIVPGTSAETDRAD